MRRMVVLLLLLALGLSIPGAPAAGADAETCLSVNPEEAGAAWERLRDRGVLYGGPAGASVDYSPYLTRAEATTVVVYAIGRREEGLVKPEVPPFPDLAGHWARGMVQVALTEGLVQGFPDGTFRPDEKATLADFQVMLAKLLRVPGPTADNAGRRLWQAGVQQEFNCPAGTVLSRGAMLLLLDQAMSVPIYRRSPGPERPASADLGPAKPLSLAEWQELEGRIRQHGVYPFHQVALDHLQSMLTRLEFAALLLNGLGYEAPGTGWEGDLPFADTPHYWIHQSAFLKEQGLFLGYPDGTVQFHAIMTVGEAQVILARLLRAGPDPTPETAGELLRMAGVEPEVAASVDEPLTLVKGWVLVDRAFSAPLYARFRHRSDCGYYSLKELEAASKRLDELVRSRTSFAESHRGSVTRAEMATLLVAVLQSYDRLTPPAVPPFADLAGHWAAAPAAVAKVEGLMSGYPDGTFRPGETLSVSEAQVILARLLRLPNPTLANAGNFLRKAGVQREFNCLSTEPMTRGMLAILLDEVLSLRE